MSTWFLMAAFVAAPAPGETRTPADWPKVIEAREFRFDTEASGVHTCAETARKAGAKVEIPTGEDGFRSLEMTVSIPKGPAVQVLAHTGSAYVVKQNTLYFADFSAWSNGCRVVAYDLASGKKLWTQPVVGIGPVEHTKYRNQVAMKLEKHPTADAWGLVVTGQETSGRYIEVLDPVTGKMLANRKFPAK